MSEPVDIGHPSSLGQSFFLANWLLTSTVFTNYSRSVMTATMLLFASALATGIGIPDVIPVPVLAMACIVILHPIAQPYMLANLIVGARTANGPTSNTAWNIMFLLSFAPYLIFLCWLLVRPVQTGLWTEALRVACLVGLYMCICDYLILAQGQGHSVLITGFQERAADRS